MPGWESLVGVKSLLRDLGWGDVAARPLPTPRRVLGGVVEAGGREGPAASLGLAGSWEMTLV